MEVLTNNRKYGIIGIDRIPYRICIYIQGMEIPNPLTGGC